jgi:hypothetical protein
MSRKPSRRRPSASCPKSVPPKSPIFTAAQHELVTKRRGELAELAFTLKAATLGFGVSKPFGDSERYDVILDARSLTPSRRRPRKGADPNPPLWRVQVKCTTQVVDQMFRLNAHRRIAGRAVPYKPGEIHFLAAYVIPEDTWYIVPLQVFLGRTSLLFRSRHDPKPGMYDEYNEAWHLLRTN